MRIAALVASHVRWYTSDGGDGFVIVIAWTDGYGSMCRFAVWIAIIAMHVLPSISAGSIDVPELLIG